MSLKKSPELLGFFSTHIADSDPENDEKTARDFTASVAADRAHLVLSQARQLAADPELSVEELGTDANRWFADADEAREWIRRVAHALESGTQAASSVIVKDSNGTVLSEGDSVQVIKDLKVKGGSSDLKRGTLIKKIHLIDDPDHIECRVDGSTLVLKTIFLKKS